MVDYSAVDDVRVFRSVAEGSDHPQLWAEFLERFQQSCYRVIRRSLLRRMGSEAAEELSDELFQSFFVSLLKNDRRLLNRYRGEGGCSPRTYLCYLAGYHVLSELRGRKNIPELFRSSHDTLDDPDQPIYASQHAPDPSKIAADREMLDTALSGLETLSDIDRRIFQAIYVENRSFKEIAKLSGDSLTTVRVQHHRLRKRLKQYLENQGHYLDDDRVSIGA